jgi:hypothetical protein
MVDATNQITVAGEMIIDTFWQLFQFLRERDPLHVGFE